MVPETERKGVVDTRGRITFRVDVDTATKFKVISGIKKMKLDELGKIAIEDMIKKNKSIIKDVFEEL